MNDQPHQLNRITTALRWVARIGSVASLALLLLFFIGEGFSPTQLTAEEWLGLLFFPFGVAAGMLLAWWKETWGGSITLLSLAAFYGLYGYLMHGEFPQGAAFLIFSAPGIVFLAAAGLDYAARSAPRQAAG
ncbi:MAG: hypothetical protein GYA17_15280 [Chloroflexi bacterium]|jgi:hypothetical protein|nr:hypothetical protein [Anaerolineaceae bacterium]NMB89721.1 hypothetical protein [Chloroflexota bacterium]